MPHATLGPTMLVRINLATTPGAHFWRFDRGSIEPRHTPTVHHIGDPCLIPQRAARKRANSAH